MKRCWTQFCARRVDVKSVTLRYHSRSPDRSEQLSSRTARLLSADYSIGRCNNQLPASTWRSDCRWFANVLRRAVTAQATEVMRSLLSKQLRGVPANENSISKPFRLNAATVRNAVTSGPGRGQRAGPQHHAKRSYKFNGFLLLSGRDAKTKRERFG